MSDWAAAWLQRMNGWESRIYELAGFDPSHFRRLKAENTLLDIAKAWKTKKALSEYAWNDR